MRWVVVDLEATCWSPHQHAALAADQRNECEIIEIGAVRVEWGPDGPRLPDSLDAFERYVRPRRHPTLSPFCCELTGISQEQIDGASWFPDVFRSFVEWAGGDEGLVVATWGAWDDRQLRRDAERWGLPEPRWQALNVRRLFARRARKTAGRPGPWMGLAAAVGHLGGTFSGRQHRALDDAINTAWVFTRFAEPNFTVAPAT